MVRESEQKYLLHDRGRSLWRIVHDGLRIDDDGASLAHIVREACDP